MMKKRFLTLVLMGFLSANLWSQSGHMTNDWNYTHCIGAGVNVRAAPNATAAILTQLSQGERVERGEERYVPYDSLLVINNLRGYWVEIKLKSGQVGYVFSPFLALGVVRSGDDPDVMFLVGRTERKDSMKVVVVQSGRTLQTLTFRASYVGEGGERFSGFRTLGKCGLPNLKEIVCLNLGAMACGSVAEDFLFAWDGRKLHYFGRSWDQSEGGGNETWIDRCILILPTDMDGEKGVVLELCESGTNVTEGETETPEGPPRPILYSDQKTRRLVWDGTKLIESK